MEAGLIELLISEWLDALEMSAKVFTSLRVLELIEFGVGVGDMIFSAIYALDFATFVLLDRTLSIMMITHAFVATGGEMEKCQKSARTFDNCSII